MNSTVLFLILVVIAYIIRHLWRSWRHPANQLGRDAADKGWVYDSVRKENVVRNVRYRRNNWITEVSFKEEKVHLVGNNGDEPKELWLSFDNYDQVDEFLNSFDEDDIYENEQGDEYKKSNDYHDDIDNQIKSFHKFFCENYSNSKSEYSLETLAVFATQISALIAINKYFPDLHRVYINTLTSSLGTRTPNTLPEVESKGNVLVSYCTDEESFMNGQTETFERAGVSPLVRNLMKHLGANEGDFHILLDRLESAGEQAYVSYLPHFTSL